MNARGPFALGHFRGFSGSIGLARLHGQIVRLRDAGTGVTASSWHRTRTMKQARWPFGLGASQYDSILAGRQDSDFTRVATTQPSAGRVQTLEGHSD